MPGRNKEYDTQLKIIRGSQRTGYENSPAFKRLDAALGRLNEAMTRLSRPGFQMTGASIAELRALYTEAAIAADKYIEHLPTWVPDRWRSDEGIRRQVGVYRLSSIITAPIIPWDWRTFCGMPATRSLKSRKSLCGMSAV